MDQQSWYIPRPSLSSNSSKNQSKFYHRDSEMLDSEKGKDGNLTMSSSSSVLSSSQRSNKIHNMDTCIDAIECDKQQQQQQQRGRGSRSSQGSDSEQSIHSASSLLLTVTNLENFAKIQERHQSTKILDNFEKIHQNATSSIINIHPNNFISSPNHLHHNFHHNKSTKELDNLSMASSTHFTMINGFGRSSMKRKSSYICKRSRQVSVLIVTMSFVFLIGISTAVILIEMRNREMPR